MNALQGVLLQWLESKGRWKVHLSCEGEDSVNLRPTNLRRLTHDEAWNQLESALDGLTVAEEKAFAAWRAKRPGADEEIDPFLEMQCLELFMRGARPEDEELDARLGNMPCRSSSNLKHGACSTSYHSTLMRYLTGRTQPNTTNGSCRNAPCLFRLHTPALPVCTITPTSVSPPTQECADKWRSRK